MKSRKSYRARKHYHRHYHPDLSAVHTKCWVPIHPLKAAHWRDDSRKVHATSKSPLRFSKHSRSIFARHMPCITSVDVRRRIQDRTIMAGAGAGAGAGAYAVICLMCYRSFTTTVLPPFMIVLSHVMLLVRGTNIHTYWTQLWLLDGNRTDFAAPLVPASHWSYSYGLRVRSYV